MLTGFKANVTMCNAVQHDDVLSSLCTEYTEYWLTHPPPIRPVLTIARSSIWTGTISINSVGLAAWLDFPASLQG